MNFAHGVFDICQCKKNSWKLKGFYKRPTADIHNLSVGTTTRLHKGHNTPVQDIIAGASDIVINLRDIKMFITFQSKISMI